MGACRSKPKLAPETSTIEQLNRIMSAQIEQLPRLQESTYGPNVLELKGDSWMFNYKAPLDSSLLQGKLSAKEYECCIKRVNQALIKCFVGKSLCCSPSDIPTRRQKAKNAVEATIAVLNKEAFGKDYQWYTQSIPPTTDITNITSVHNCDRPTVVPSTVHFKVTSILLIFKKAQNHDKHTTSFLSKKFQRSLENPFPFVTPATN